jgi:hypothetical protein
LISRAKLSRGDDSAAELLNKDEARRIAVKIANSLAA